MQIRFEKYFARNARSYDSPVGDWWAEKSQDRPHKKAYRNMVEWMRQLISTESPTILDYACGNGVILPALQRAFPSARLIGLDGSRRMLEMAHKHVSQDIGKAQVQLIRTSLPNFHMEASVADIVLFLFPNMNYSLPRHYSFPDNTVKIARLLSALQGRRNQTDIRDLLKQRVIAENIHRLLKKNGLWIKAEYSGIARDQLSSIAQWQLLFKEAAFEGRMGRRSFQDLFEFQETAFFRSRVVNDVYDQTLNRADLRGGYFLSSLRKR